MSTYNKTTTLFFEKSIIMKGSVEISFEFSIILILLIIGGLCFYLLLIFEFVEFILRRRVEDKKTYSENHVCTFYADPFENSPRVLRCECGKSKLNPDYKTSDIGFH